MRFASDIEKMDKVWLESLPHLIVALPRRPLDINSVVLELEALKILQKDQELLAQDPLILPEIIELKANLFEYLVSELDDLVEPEKENLIWYEKGNPIRDESEEKAIWSIRDTLLALFRARFPLTPKINNEQIVRRRVTRVSKSARKRCILGILERSGSPDLGYSGASSADASIFRTVLAASGLYRKIGKEWNWVRDSSELSDPGMGAILDILKDFFSIPAQYPKSFSTLVQHLTQAPVGLRTGVVPLMLAVGFKAFGICGAPRQRIEDGWLYVDDITPNVIEMMAEQPDLFELEVLAYTEEQAELIRALALEFNPAPEARETDLLRAFYDAILHWQNHLPPAAFRSRGLGKEASDLQRVLRQTNNDPAHLLFRAFPDIAQRHALDAACMVYVSIARQQMEAVTARYITDAINVAKLVFAGRGQYDGMNEFRDASLPEIADRWAALLPIALDESSVLDRPARGILSRARKALDNKYSEIGFIRALSGILSGVDFEAWDDSSARDFEHALRGQVRKIEDAVLSLEDNTEGLSLFLRDRISLLLNKHMKAAGSDVTRGFIDEILEKI